MFKLTGKNITLVCSLFELMELKEHSAKLICAYSNYKYALENLRSNTAPRCMPFSDDCNEVHETMKNRITSYQNAYEELIKTWEYHVNLITVKPLEEL